MSNTIKAKNAKIANIQFLLSVMVVFIHATTIFVNLPDNSLQYIYGRNFSTFIQIFIGDGICRIAVPCFFVISGYLFYSTFSGTWQEYTYKLKRRIYSLIIPYLIWSSLVFIVFFAAQHIPSLSAYFTTRNENTISLRVIWENVIVGSYNSPLWYVRYLIVFSVLSVVFYRIVKNVPILLCIITFYGWVVGFKNFNIGTRMDALFFYSVGAIIGVHKNIIVQNILSKYNKAKKQYFACISTILWLVVLFLRTLYYCNQDPHMMLDGNYDMYVIYTGYIAIILGLISLWNIYGLLNNSKIWKISEYSFLIFVMHHPIVNTLKKLLMKLMGVNLLSSLLTFFISAALTIALVIAFGYILKKYATPFWKIASGRR